MVLGLPRRPNGEANRGLCTTNAVFASPFGNPLFSVQTLISCVYETGQIVMGVENMKLECEIVTGHCPAVHKFFQNLPLDFFSTLVYSVLSTQGK